MNKILGVVLIVLALAIAVIPHTVMQPSLVALGVLVSASGLLGMMLSFRKKE